MGQWSGNVFLQGHLRSVRVCGSQEKLNDVSTCDFDISVNSKPLIPVLEHLITDAKRDLSARDNQIEV